MIDTWIVLRTREPVDRRDWCEMTAKRRQGPEVEPWPVTPAVQTGGGFYWQGRRRPRSILAAVGPVDAGTGDGDGVG